MIANPDKIEKDLKKAVGSTIYGRGFDYWRRGKVRNLQVFEPTDNETSVAIAGKVEGDYVYDVTAVCNLKSGRFGDLECSCPYGFGCKHSVAIILAYTDSLRKEILTESLENVDNDQIEAEVRAGLRQLGFDDTLIASNVIDNLVRQKSATLKSAVEVEKIQPKPVIKKFDPAQYVVVLNSMRGYTPSLHVKGNYQQEARVAPLLARADVAEEDKLLLAFIRDSGSSVDYYYSSKIDLSVLFPLLINSHFKVYCGDGFYYNSNPRPIRVNLDPPTIAVQAVFRKVPYPYDPHGETYKPVITMMLSSDGQPTQRLNNSNNFNRSPFRQVGSVLVREAKNELFLYQLNPSWTNILGRMYRNYVPGVVGEEESSYIGTDLDAKEIDKLETLVEQAGEQIVLSLDEKLQSFTPVRNKPMLILEIDFDATEKSLQVLPIIDYGCWRIELTARVARRYQGPIRYTTRSVYERDEHYVLVDGVDQLSYVPLQPKKEIAYYKLLEANQEEIGFTKKLHCLQRGKTRVERYLSESWPVLAELAKENKIPIVFTRDILPTEKVALTANFKSEIEPDLDWLHFDIDLYCAGEKVTLKKLYDFMESGDSYWRKDDGTLVEIENRAELERLVRLLQSFREREAGGFEGKLHHAPELNYVMTSSSHYSAVQNKGLKAFMTKVEAGKPVKKVKLPKRVEQMLRPYQRVGVEWLYFLRSYHFAGVLADDMGLGKTVQALTMISLEKKAGVPSLVVCPKSLLYNWQKEANLFFPDLKVLVYDGSPVTRSEMSVGLTEYDLIVVSYSTLMRDHSILCGVSMQYHYAVLDEAQYIKNHLTKVAQRVKEIPADYRLALTGTPLENHVFELWSIYDYLMPGFLGQHNQFRDRFHRPIMETSDPDALAHLRKKVESFMLRRTKEEVLTELPPKVEQIRECVLSDAQNVLYQQILAEVRGNVYSTVSEKGFKGSQIHILAGLTKLRQVCNHPALLTKDSDYSVYESAKLDMCLELVEEVRQSGRKVLIFSQFTGMLDILAKALTKNDIQYCYLSGQTRKRQEVIDRFNDKSEITAFLISMKAGGTGLNLTSADNVIVFDPWWNPSVERQAVDRAHRMGQTKSVNVYRLVTKGTIEEKIQLLKNKKQNLFDAVIEESGELFKKLTWEDVQDLFK